METCYKLNVTEVTIYAFSIENFNRPKEEVDTLFGMLRDKLQYMSEWKDSYVHKYKVRVKIIGNKSMIPEDILKDLNQVEERTNIPEAERTLNICFPYTSRDDITHSIQAISRQRDCNSISRDDIDETLLGHNMYMGANSLPLDLLIRTSGHYRLSDFMLWQSTKDCKVEFINTLWPNFKFLSLFGILLNWSFQKYSEERQARAKNPKELFQVKLDSLPKPPPFVCVGDKPTENSVADGSVVEMLSGDIPVDGEPIAEKPVEEEDVTLVEEKEISSM